VNRTDVHRMVDELPEASLEAAAAWLGRLSDTAITGLQMAPQDDEAFTQDERRAAYRALLGLDGGVSIPLADLTSELEGTDERQYVAECIV
jgi:hypothetical protein